MIRTAALAVFALAVLLMAYADVQRYEFEQTERERAEQIAARGVMRWSGLDDASRKMVAFDRIGK